MRRAWATVALIATLMTPPAAAQMRASDLKAQLRQLSDWWPGRYDNHEQIVRQSGGGLSVLTDKPFFRLHTTVERVTGSPLGDMVFAVKTYRGPDQNMPVGTELRAVAIDEAAQALRVRRFTVAASGPSVPLSAGCDLLLRYVGGQFEGNVASRGCAVPGGFADDEVVVGPIYQWVRGRTLSRSGRVVAELAPGSDFGWFQQTRARNFACTVHGTATGDMRKTEYLRTIRLHDQGGEADIPWPDGRTLTFTIHTRAFAVPASRENPLFRVHEKGNPVPIAYAYAVDGTKRFGLNLGWFYIRCYAEGDESEGEPGLTPAR